MHSVSNGQCTSLFRPPPPPHLVSDALGTTPTMPIPHTYQKAYASYAVERSRVGWNESDTGQRQVGFTRPSSPPVSAARTAWAPTASSPNARYIPGCACYWLCGESSEGALYNAYNSVSLLTPNAIPRSRPSLAAAESRRPGRTSRTEQEPT